MAQTASNVTRILKDYVRELAKAKIHPDKVVLFGSCATGAAGPWSDIDVSIISKDLAGKGILERQLLLGRANKDLQAPLDVVGYSLEEWNHCEPGTLLYEILKNGKELSLRELLD